jgi:transcriptional regulator with XRE-family HTH domain
MPKALQALRYRGLPAMLRQIREDAELTQRDLAKKLRLHHSLVHNSETAERRVDVMEFIDWCEACGVNPADAFQRLLKQRRA